MKRLLSFATLSIFLSTLAPTFGAVPQLTDLKKHLEKLQKVYDINYQGYRVGEAINAIDEGNSQEKRNTTFVHDLSREYSFSIYASTYVFPKLLQYYIESQVKELGDLNKSLLDEITETPEEVKKLINQVSHKLEKLSAINQAYVSFVKKAYKSLNDYEDINHNTFNINQIGHYIRKTNIEIFENIDTQILSMMNISEEIERSIGYCQNHINDIIAGNLETLSTTVKHLAQIRASLKGLDLLIDRYEGKQKTNFTRLEKLYTDRNKELFSRIGKDAIRSKRLMEYIKDYSFAKVNNNIFAFTAEKDLNAFIKLLAFEGSEESIFKELMPYLGQESWHSRYEEPETHEKESKDKSEDSDSNKKKKKKIGLIDLENDKDLKPLK